MATMKKATAAAVSRALTDAGVTKSISGATRIKGMRRNTRGFIAENDRDYDYAAGKYVPTGTVIVSWASGNFMCLDGDRERGASSLAKAAEVLTAKGFTVETIKDDYRTVLSVTRPTA